MCHPSTYRDDATIGHQTRSHRRHDWIGGFPHPNCCQEVFFYQGQDVLAHLELIDAPEMKSDDNGKMQAEQF